MSKSTGAATTPQASASTKNRALTSPMEQLDAKKPVLDVSSIIPEENAMYDGSAMANVSFTQENMVQLSALLKDSLEAQLSTQLSTMVSTIVEGVLSGINTAINSLQEENNELKTKVAALESKLDKAEQYSRRNCLRLS